MFSLVSSRRLRCPAFATCWLMVLALVSGGCWKRDQLNYATPYTFTTLAGTAGASARFTPGGGYADGTGSAAQLGQLCGIATDNNSNLYVADITANAVRKITPTGVVTTLPNTGGDLRGVAVDAAGSIYVADCKSYTIRKITSTGAITTFAGSPGISGSADGTGSSAQFNYPMGLAVDLAGNVFVADVHNHTIRKITSAGVVTTLAGSPGIAGSADGTGSAARFNIPSAVAVDSAGNLYVADQANRTIRKISPAGVVTTLAGQAGIAGNNDGGLGGYGSVSTALFRDPIGVAVDKNRNVYVADFTGNTIRKITSEGMVTTLAGTAGKFGGDDGIGKDALFRNPWGIAVDRTGIVYVSDGGNRTVRKGVPPPPELEDAKAWAQMAATMIVSVLAVAVFVAVTWSDRRKARADRGGAQRTESGTG